MRRARGGENGGRTAYANICRKEDYRIPNLFIGRGSDGKRHYSTFHSCRKVIVLRIDGQPESLAKFVGIRYLNEFDSCSDEGRNRTWPLRKGQSDPKASERGRW